MFTRSKVIVLTYKSTNTARNKQPDISENIQRSSLCYDDG